MPPINPAQLHHATHSPFVKSATSKTAIPFLLVVLCATATLLALPLKTEAVIQFGNVTSHGLFTEGTNCTGHVCTLTAPAISGSNTVLLLTCVHKSSN